MGPDTSTEVVAGRAPEPEPALPRPPRLKATFGVCFVVMLAVLGAFGHVVTRYRPERLLWVLLLEAVLVVSLALSLLFIYRQQKALERALRTARAHSGVKARLEFLQAILDALPTPVFIKNLGGRYIGCNAAFARHMDLDRERILGRTLREIGDPDLADVSDRFDRDTLVDPGVRVYEATTGAAGERPRNLIFNTSPYFGAEGAPAGIVGTLQDISRRKEMEDELWRLKEFNEMIVRTLAEGVLVADDRHRITFANPAAAALLGYPAEELLGLHEEDIIAPQHRDVVREANERRARGLSDHYEIDLQKRDGHLIHVVVGGGPLFREGRFSGTIAVFTDISAQQRMAEEIRELSLHDDLTGLYNRRGLFEVAKVQLHLADRIERRMIIVFVDVDDLKLVNDRHGHDEGDRVLVETGRILRRTFRHADLIARIGGDEFVVLALETSDASAETFRARLLEKVAEHNQQVGASPGALSLSVGVVAYEPHSAAPLEELIAEADQLMYDDKRRKKPVPPERAAAF